MALTTSKQFEDLFAVPLRNGLTSPKAVRGSGTKMINMGEIFAHARIGSIEMDRVPLTAKEAESYLIERGDLLFARQSLVLSGAGKYSVSLGSPEPVTFESHLIRARLDSDVADPFFYFYFFNSRQGRQTIETIVEQVAAAGIRGSDLARLEVPYPPLPEQRAIAHILGTLDDKIELNRRMNETLEAIARALFKSWFVDFDPVRGKAEGWDTGLPPHIAELFPDRFEDSELGEIPAGWRVAQLGSHVTAERGLSYNGAGLRDDGTGLPMHNLNSIYEGGGYKHEGIKFYDGEYREKHLANPGDMIITNTEQGFDHLLIGHAAIVPDRYGPQGLFSHHIFRISVKPGSPFTSHYLVQLFNEPSWHQLISGFSNGTTINMLPLDALVIPMIVVPPEALVAQFSRVAATIHSKIEAAGNESRTLAGLRDALLPKLISGEIRVKGERVTGAAT